MFEKIGRGWELAKLSYAVLRVNKQLLLFPLISFTSMLLVLASFAPLGWPMLSHQLEGQFTHADKLNSFVLMFMFYWVNYTVITFCNVALMSATLEALDGGEPTLSSGFACAASKWAPILAYSALAATVGVILQMIAERVGWLGQIVVRLVGMAWTIAVALVVPVLAAEDAGPFQAIGRSGSLIKEAWGEGLVGRASIHAFTGLLILAVFLLGAAGVMVTASAHLLFLTGLIVLAGLLAIGMLLLVQETLSQINLAVLYRYANGEETPGYDSALLAQAFNTKR